MSQESSNSKRIAKNTFLLYVRMAFLMLINLYTSRVVLSALGIDDFGIYSVVGGIVTMFTFVSASLAAAISRFLTFELGRNDLEKLKLTFSSSVIIMFLFSFFVVVISETVGLWFLNEKMNIPGERLIAANWVFQFSILTFCVNLISVPYNATIIAHEKMSAFAYISIIEAMGKLLVAYLIIKAPIDRLAFFSLLISIIAVLLRFVYGIYCHRYFEESRFLLKFDSSIVKEMFGFAGWNLIGAGSYVLMNQGVDVLVNLFFGVTYNAARGVATSVNHAALQLVNNFSTAIRPQIIKSYANSNHIYLESLVLAGAKYSYFLVLYISFPFLLESDYILSLWLVEVPEYASVFTKLTIVIIMISVLSETLKTTVMATGKVKIYEICAGGIGMLIFPFVYIAFKLGFPAYIAYVIHSMVFVLQLIYRLYYASRNINISCKSYMSNVILKIIPVTILSIIIPLSILFLFKESTIRFLSVLLVSMVCITLSIYMVGLSGKEKVFVVERLRSLILKKDSSQ